MAQLFDNYIINTIITATNKIVVVITQQARQVCHIIQTEWNHINNNSINI